MVTNQIKSQNDDNYDYYIIGDSDVGGDGESDGGCSDVSAGKEILVEVEAANVKCAVGN